MDSSIQQTLKVKCLHRFLLQSLKFLCFPENLETGGPRVLKLISDLEEALPEDVSLDDFNYYQIDKKNLNQIISKHSNDEKRSLNFFSYFNKLYFGDFFEWFYIENEINYPDQCFNEIMAPKIMLTEEDLGRLERFVQGYLTGKRIDSRMPTRLFYLY